MALVIPDKTLAFERNRHGDRIELGRGVFASVFCATFRGEPVAVKSLIIPVGASAGALAELERVFAREAALLFHVRHEGVVPLLGAAVDREVPGGPPFELALVMLLMARSLEAAVAAAAAGPADLALRLRLLQQVARALRFLHASGIVHGDLKPAKVLLDFSGTHALLCDFGHARLRDASPDALRSPSVGAWQARPATETQQWPLVAACCVKPQTSASLRGTCWLAVRPLKAWASLLSFQTRLQEAGPTSTRCLLRSQGHCVFY